LRKVGFERKEMKKFLVHSLLVLSLGFAPVVVAAQEMQTHEDVVPEGVWCGKAFGITVCIYW
jgi:hypothetical protein